MMRLCNRAGSLAAGLIAILCMYGAARADEPVTITLTIKDHQFTPSKVIVPAGKPSVLVIRNEDATPEEFESPDLRVTELIILGGREQTIELRPLDPGEYPFEGEFHTDTAKGVVIAQLEEQSTVNVTIKDHQFTPSKVVVPAGKPSVLVIRNEDATPEQIQSSELRLEEVMVLAGKETRIELRPLEPGSYPFEGGLHADTAKGVVVADVNAGGTLGPVTIHTPYGIDFALSSDWDGQCRTQAYTARDPYIGCSWRSKSKRGELWLMVSKTGADIDVGRAATVIHDDKKKTLAKDSIQVLRLSGMDAGEVVVQGNPMKTSRFSYHVVPAGRSVPMDEWRMAFLPIKSSTHSIAVLAITPAGADVSGDMAGIAVR